MLDIKICVVLYQVAQYIQLKLIYKKLNLEINLYLNYTNVETVI